MAFFSGPAGPSGKTGPVNAKNRKDVSSRNRMIKTTENLMNTNTEKLAGDLKRVVADAEDILRSTTEEAGEKARDARDRLLAAVEHAKASCQQMEEKAIAGARAADKIVRDHPYQSIGVAFGIGLLAGYLITRK
jgi:ElaB/YqjD/DUF883 family membrane-anchored ribosome-binding protein